MRAPTFLAAMQCWEVENRTLSSVEIIISYYYIIIVLVKLLSESEVGLSRKKVCLGKESRMIQEGYYHSILLGIVILTSGGCLFVFGISTCLFSPSFRCSRGRLVLYILNHSFHSTATKVNFQLSLLLCSSTIHCPFFKHCLHRLYFLEHKGYLL